MRCRSACLAVLALAALFNLAWLDVALAQGSPFGIPGPRPTERPAPSGGIGTWLLMQQAAFHRSLTGALSTLRDSQTGIATLFGIAFAYGVVHAIGPGHGKAVIASYIIANEATLRRGILLSFAAAGVQALVGILAVGIIILALGGTGRSMEGALVWIERIGFLLIALVGLSILWRRLRLVFAGNPSEAHCGHDHGPDAQAIAAKPFRELLVTALGAGLRPCTGAIILLVFALTQGLFWAGALAVGMMALGTAIGTSAFAFIAVKAKHVALTLAQRSNTWARRATLLLEALAGALLAMLGLLLLTGTLGVWN